MNAIHFHTMLYICIVDKWDPFYLFLLQDNPFFYCLVQFWVHLLVSQIPTGGSREVGKESMNTIPFCPMLYTCIMDKSNHLIHERVSDVGAKVGVVDCNDDIRCIK
jgi:hypothetical protein